MMELFMQFICAILMTFGFSIIFNVPRHKIPLCCIVGIVSWMSYQAFLSMDTSPVFATFVSSCLVWLCSNIFARVFKETSTMFIIPGIISLVPGAGTYYSMLAMLEYTDKSFGDTTKETVLVAGAIAAGLLLMGSVTGVAILLTKKIKRAVTSRKNQS